MENWRDIPGYEGRYMVSDLGRVRGRRVNFLQQMLDRDGYLKVTLTGAKSKQSRLSVHLLVLVAFVGPKPPSLVSRHLNNIRSDNRLSNLLYGTGEKNFADRYDHGTWPAGEKNGNAKLSVDDVAYIKAQSRARGMRTKLAKQFGVTRTQIAYILAGKSWIN